MTDFGIFFNYQNLKYRFCPVSEYNMMLYYNLNVKKKYRGEIRQMSIGLRPKLQLKSIVYDKLFFC